MMQLRPYLRTTAATLAAAVLAVAALVIAPGQDPADAQPPGTPSKPAIFHNGTWYLRNSMTTGAANLTFPYGRQGDIPVMGDWDGNGTDTVGIVRFTEVAPFTFVYTWHLKNTNSGGAASVAPFQFGGVRFVAVDQLGTIPVVGDWNGDGVDTIGVVYYDFDLDGPVRWELRNSNVSGPADIVMNYGRGRDIPLTGDWDGNGTDTPGVVRNTTWLLRNAAGGGSANVSFPYGSASTVEINVPGDWDGNGTDTPAVLRNIPSSNEEGPFQHWLFRNSNSGGAASGQIVFGGSAQTVSLPIEYSPRLSWK